MGTWTNDDGLTIRIGVAEAEKGLIGEYRNDGPEHVVEVYLDWNELPAVASNSVNISTLNKLPANIQIEAVEIVTYTDFDSAGDAMTLNVGIADADGGSTVTDVDALVVAATQAELNTGGTNVTGWVGAAVGTVIAESTYLTWEVDAAAATAGSGVLRVFYSVPKKTTDTLGT